MTNKPDYIPYVYEIVYKPTLQRYIGVRYGERIKGKLPEEDLGVNYFSSSSVPILERQYQEKNVDKFEYKILACFPDDAEAAREYEEHLHLYYNVGSDQQFLNLAIGNQKAGFTKKTAAKGTQTRKNSFVGDLPMCKYVGIESARTRSKKDEHGNSIQDKINKKLSVKFKGTRSGKNNSNSKSYRIYREDGSLFDEIPLDYNIREYVKKHELPASLYTSQLKGGKPILNEQMSCHVSVHKHLLSFKGWYCVSINEKGYENHFYDSSEVIRYVMVDKNSNVVEFFGRNKTLKNEAKNRGWPMNSIYKSYSNGGKPVFYDSREEEITKQQKRGIRWLCDYCFVKIERDGNFYHHWVEKDRKINIGD